MATQAKPEIIHGNARVREIGGAALAQMSTAAAITMAEVDKQITTAHAYPRSITKFIQEGIDLVTLRQSIADECIYSLPRGGKTIEGPSSRFAEIIASCWGNSRAGARVMGEEKNFVIAQGIYHDLERNVAITYEVKRRITDSKGERYNDDMIQVTGQAACSIAHRNAVLKGVPKAFWVDIYEAARKVAEGDADTLEKRRLTWLTALEGKGIKREQVFRTLGVKGIRDMGLNHLVQLKGIENAVKNGEYTLEEAYSEKGVEHADPEDEAAHARTEAETGQRLEIQQLLQQLGHQGTSGEVNMAIGQAGGDMDAVIADLTKQVEAKRTTERAEVDKRVEKEQAKPAATAKTEEKSGQKKKGLF